MMDAPRVMSAAASEQTEDAAERELSTDSLRFLADVSSELSTTLEYETTLANVARLTVPFFADWCTVDMLREDGTIVRLAAAAADPEKERILTDLSRRYPVEANADHPVAIALRDRTPLWTVTVTEAWLTQLARDDEHLALLRALAPISSVVAPLLARGHTLGALTFAFAESGRRYGASDIELARELARRAALAIDNARLYREAQAEIAARRRLEQELRFRTSLLEAQSEASIEGILVVSPERRMIAYNRRFLEIWNLNPALIEGDSSAAAESVMHSVVDPEPMKALTAYLYEHPDEAGRDEIPLKDGRTIERNSAPIRGADGVNYGRVWFYRNVTEHKRTADALRLLADASTELSTSLEYETTLANVARLAVPLLADWCTVDMLEEDGAIVRLATAAADPEKERILRELYRRYPVERNADHPITIALRGGLPHWNAEVTEEWLTLLARDEEHLALLRTLNPVSALVVPLVARDHMLGALTFAFGDSGRRYGPADVELAHDLARRAALAIDNARLYREAQAEIGRRKRAEDVQRALLQISEAAHTAQDLPQLYRVIHEIIKSLIGARNFYIAVYDRQTELFSFPYYADEVDPPPEPRALKRGVTEYVLKTGSPLLADLERIAELHRSGAVEQVGSPSAIWLGVPLTIDGRTFGVMAVQDYHDATAFGDEEQQILSFISEQVALAIERKRAESALRERESTLQAIVAASPDIIAVREMDGSVRQESASVREVLGYAPATPQQQRPFRFIHPDDREGQVREFDSLVSGRAERSLSRYRYRHADGHWLTLESHRRVIRDADGLPAGVAAVTRDVSRQAELEEALRQSKEEAERADRAKSEFLSRMSHELRTPLNAILGFAEVMEMDPQTTAKQHERLKHIVKGGRHLLGLINEVLDIARIETGRLSLSPEPVAVADLVYEALDLTRPLAAQRNVRLLVESPEHFDHHVQADAQRLKQVLLNLLANGVKYNRDGGSVTVIGEERGGGAVRLSLRDTGPGIPAEKLDRLFTPFERLGAESSGVEGTGLGLAIAKRLIEAMGGSIGVESAAGSGSTFWLELPRTESPLHQFATDERALLRFGGAAAERQATVLYIEDNLANLELMEHVLAFRPGVRLLPAITGTLGLSLARAHQPDLILLDLNLPDIQGDEILRRLREDQTTRETPVIVISADATEHQIQRLLAAGARAYLTKPLEVKRLLDVLERHL